MQTNQAKNPKLARANFDIGNYFLNTAKDNENALKVHKYNAEHFPNVMEAMWSQAAIVWYDVRHNDFANADIEYAKLIDVYKDQDSLAKEIYQIGDIYLNEKKNYEKALSLYKYQVEKWPKYGEPTDTYRRIACAYIGMKDIENADAVIGKMQTDFSQDPHLPRANFDIGNFFLNDANDPNNALKVHKYNADNYPKVMEAMWSQAALVWYYVRHDNQANAETEYAKLLNVYKDQKTLAKEIFQIADIWTEVGNTAKARTLHNQVLTQWPESEYVFNAKTGLIKADIADDKDSDVMTGIDTLIKDYSNRSDLTNTVFQFGEQYMKKAVAKRVEEFSQKTVVYTDEIKPPNEKVISNYSAALKIWEKIISNSPGSSIACEASFMAGETSQNLNEYQKAINHYKSVVDNWSDYKYAWLAQDRILKLYPALYKAGIISESQNISLIHEGQNTLLEKFPDSPAADKIRQQIENSRERERIKNMTSIQRFEYLRNKANQGGQK
jgi:tetratricopeptide (TPR) repeat protein